jgi:hypothetical protein
MAWHVTPARNLPAIEREGLLPRIGPRAAMLGERASAVYLFPDLATAEDALMSWLGEALAVDGELALLEVATDGLAQDEGAGFEIAVLEAIPPSRLRVARRDIDEGAWPAPEALWA